MWFRRLGRHIVFAYFCEYFVLNSVFYWILIFLLPQLTYIIVFPLFGFFFGESVAVFYRAFVHMRMCCAHMWVANVFHGPSCVVLFSTDLIWKNIYFSSLDQRMIVAPGDTSKELVLRYPSRGQGQLSFSYNFFFFVFFGYFLLFWLNYHKWNSDSAFADYNLFFSCISFVGKSFVNCLIRKENGKFGIHNGCKWNLTNGSCVDSN